MRLMVHGPAGQRLEIDAVIDTGFDGWLTLPLASIIPLGLAWDSTTPLIDMSGMFLPEGFALTIHVRAQGDVAIAALP